MVFLYWKDTNFDIVDGDILLYDLGEYPDELYNDAVGLPSRLWTKVDDVVKIPYTLPNDVPEFDLEQINLAIEEFHLKTCIRYFKNSSRILLWISKCIILRYLKTQNRFVPRNQEVDFVRIDTVNYPNYCASTMGKKGGEQIVRAGNCKENGTLSWGLISHELMHVAGSWIMIYSFS